MRLARVFSVALIVIGFTGLAVAAESAETSSVTAEEACRQCGVIFEIRPITSERAIARTFEERAPEAGPFINIPLDGTGDAKPRVGVIGSREMRERLNETMYEIVVRFDDGRFALFETANADGLSLGLRVRVNQNRVEPIDQ